MTSAAPAVTNPMTVDVSQDVPIFLRKTYHMVDTCDPSVCSWSEDGETFVVKHPKKFEQEIIPQFFKHSKFSSFVRQLNFYAFRKIKTNDSLRIDADLEEATANHWRFFHPKFQKGKPEWLLEIKRSSSTPRGSGSKKAAGKSAVPASVGSSGAALGKENLELKSEVTTLKERIEAMNKNIDMLTTMVQNVSMAQKAEVKVDDITTCQINENNKRTKTVIASPTCVPDEISSTMAKPDAAPSMPSPASFGTADKEPPSNPLVQHEDSSLYEPVLSNRETSGTTELSDEGFVDSLFTAFKGPSEDTDDVMIDAIDLASSPDEDTENMKLNDPWLNSSPLESNSNGKKNGRSHAELMKLLSDALILLPQEIQELIVDRLIQAITSPKEVQESLQAAKALKDADKASSAKNAIAAGLPTPVPLSPRHSTTPCEDAAMMTDDERSTTAASVVPASSPNKTVPNPSLHLAAATLAALLSQYGKAPQDTAKVVAATNVLIPVSV